MILYCKNCGERLPEGGLFCDNCGSDNEFQYKQAAEKAETAARKKQERKKMLLIFAIVAVIVSIPIGLIVWDFADPPLWWQSEAQANKKAIMEYVKINYPEAKISSQHYESTKLRVGAPQFSDYIFFELDGIKFLIRAQHGEILSDGYPYSVACAQFDKIIEDGFLIPRGLTAQVDYRFADHVPQNLSPYTGVLGVTLKVYDQGSTPQEVGWLYDFYEYWQSNAGFLDSYSVLITIHESNHIVCHVRFNDDTVFPNEDVFYAAFKQG